jgi:hypothetical protein
MEAITIKIKEENDVIEAALAKQKMKENYVGGDEPTRGSTKCRRPRGNRARLSNH